MLSAVAARKARLAQSQAQNTTPAPSSSASPPPAETKRKVAPLAANAIQKPPSSKRKSSTTSVSTAPKKKRREQRRPPEQPARYFAQLGADADALKTQEDVIVVDESDGESSASSHSLSMDEDVANPPVPVGGGARRKRAWSPSAPLPDSSDEDDDADEPVILDFPLSAPIEQTPAEPPSALSNFDPVLNQNVFHFAPGECPVGDSAHKSTILLLRSGESLALLGTYTLTILRGTINLAGVQLSASRTSHPVYAPRSSPIPLIQCRLSRSTSSSSSSSSSTAPASLLPALPQRVADASPNFDAVLLLQELHTGIEGLGRICRPFDGGFTPARWHRSQALSDIGFDTVYLVRCLNIFLPYDTPV